jgi:glycosyltransferase involved in cell wall biosynthesis
VCIIPNVILIEPCNFEDFPVGGQLSVAKQMISIFGNRLALVGISTDETPIGRWVKKKFDGVEYDFFAVGRWIPSSRKPLVPARITAYLQMKRYKKKIMSLGVKSAFIQSPEILMAGHKWGWNSICYWCAGLGNPLDMPRYRWGKLLAGLFFKKWINSLAKADVILAAADDKLIDAFVTRSGGALAKDRVIKFPTRVETSVFRPTNKAIAGKELGIHQNDLLIVNCGRINAVKGWDLIIEAFKVFNEKHPAAKLVYVGDGEDRPALEQAINRFGLSQSVAVTGFQPPEIVAKYLNAADLCVVGSHMEGWSVAMLEALACGKPIVSTDVSGALDMILEGGNGYIVEKRDPNCFAEAMNRALALKEADTISLGLADKYALKNLARELGMLWKPLA